MLALAVAMGALAIFLISRPENQVANDLGGAIVAGLMVGLFVLGAEELRERKRSIETQDQSRDLLSGVGRLADDQKAQSDELVTRIGQLTTEQGEQSSELAGRIAQLQTDQVEGTEKLVSGLDTIVGVSIDHSDKLLARVEALINDQSEQNEDLLLSLRRLTEDQRALAAQQAKLERLKDIEVSMLRLLATEIRPLANNFITILKANAGHGGMTPPEVKDEAHKRYLRLLEAQFGLHGLAHLADDDEMKGKSHRLGLLMTKAVHSSNDFGRLSGTDPRVIEDLRLLNNWFGVRLGLELPTDLED